MSAQFQEKTRPLLVAVLIFALLPIFTFTSMSNGLAATTISTQAELEAITNLSGNYILGADIKLVTPSSGANPIFLQNFTGTFDGAGHTISGLTGPFFKGIAGEITKPATVSNLNLATVGTGIEATGILADSLLNYSTVNNVKVSGKLLYRGVNMPVGGLIATAQSNTSIENSSAEVTLVLNITEPSDGGEASVGGLIAETQGSILNSYAKAIIEVVGQRNIGGLVGVAYQATIENSASSGNITGGRAGSHVGGLVGIALSATIRNSYSSVDVSTLTNSSVGGLLGTGQDVTSRHTEILNSYATGSVINQGEKVGGLIGYIEKGLILNCIAEGRVTGLRQAGGLIGYVKSSSINYSRASGDVVGNKLIGGLIGQVDVIDPTVIASARTIKDSSASGSVSSTGSSAENIGGLIGYVSRENVLTNISASGMVIAPNAKWVGGLIGQTLSEVSQASASGNVNAAGGDQVGGLVGFSGMNLTNTSSSGAVTGFSIVGKLAGYVDATIYDSKSSGSSIVTGPIGTSNQLEGFSNLISQTSDVGPTQSTGPLSTLLDQLNTSQSPERWAVSSRINAFRPYIKALLGLGFYESTVTFDANGGSGTMDVQTNTGPADLTHNGFTRPGYTFEGWAESRNGSLRYRDERTYHFQSNQTLYAVWKAIIAVSYNLGGGIGTLPTQTDVSEGSSFITAVSTGLSKAGFTFNKWNDGLVDISANASYTVSTSNVILTATWTANATSPPVVVYIPPPPQPYLSVGTTPSLHRSGAFVVCSSGTYDYGVTYFDGTPNSLTKSISITTFQYRFFVDGAENKDLAIFSPTGAISISISKLPAKGLLTCQVTVERGGVSIIASSTLNTAGIGAAETLRNTEIEKSNMIYQSTLKANIEVKKSAIIANHKQWRDAIDTARSVFAASRTVAKSSKEVVAAARIQSLSVAKAAANYKQGISLIDSDYLKMNALAEKMRKETQKNLDSNYASFLEVNGYGVSLDATS